MQSIKPYLDKIERYAEFGYERPSVRVTKETTLVLAVTYLYLKPAQETDTVAVSPHFVEMLGDVYSFIYKPPGRGNELERRGGTPTGP